MSRLVTGLTRAMLTLALVLAVPNASAHKGSDSYLWLTPDDRGWAGRLDIAIADLERVVGIDHVANRDGNVTWGELTARRDAVDRYIVDRLSSVRTRDDDSQPCTLSPTEYRLTKHSDGPYLAVTLRATCPAGGTGDSLRLRYDLLFDTDASHRAFVAFDHGARTTNALLSPSHRTALLRTEGSGLGTIIGSYLREGVWHIWLGFDHLLFLLTLLIPTALLRRNGNWRPVSSLRAALWDTGAIVTAFTLAHALTLSASVLSGISVPGQWVESAIALSIVAVAVNNVWPIITARRALVAFTLGLVHGLGFAGALGELGLPAAGYLAALAAFNAGVELGQLGFVVVVVPPIYLARTSTLYSRFVLPGGSLAIGLVAIVWLVERSTGIPLLS